MDLPVGQGGLGTWSLFCSPLKTRASRCSLRAGSFKRPRTELATTGNGEIEKQGHLKPACDPGVEPYWVALSKHGHWATVVGGLGTP